MKHSIFAIIFVLTTYISQSAKASEISVTTTEIFDETSLVEAPLLGSEIPTERWENEELYDDENRLSSSIINTLAGQIHTLLESETELSATILGHALPRNSDSLQFTQVQRKSRTFEKKFTSILGFDLIVIKYRVSYDYHMVPNQGAGFYLANVKFTPLDVKIDPLWSLKVSGTSDVPTNSATPEEPIASLGFSLTFTADGVGGTRSVSDEFRANAKSGQLDADITPFE